jgi:jumonji domain-containing protein 7
MGDAGLSFAQGVEATRDHFPGIPRVSAASLTPLSFLRAFVAPSRPVILQHACQGWRALAHWTPEYLAAQSGAALVTLSRTPNGRADAAERDGNFYLPHNERCALADALARLQAGPGEGRRCGTPYLSAQDDCLRQQTPLLAADVGAVAVAEAALGAAEAVNLWIAPPSAGAGACAAPPVSTTHKDHYENLLTVVSGSKTFTLLPPTDAAFLPTRRCPVMRYAHNDAACSGCSAQGAGACWTAQAEGEGPAACVPWITADPDAPDMAAHPLLAMASPLRCTVRAGETLYLPALWYHQVGVGEGEEGLTIAVNKWFEMQHGVAFVAQQMMAGLLPQS